MCTFFHLIKHLADQFTCTNGTIISGIYPDNTKLNLEQSLTVTSKAVIVDAEIAYNRKAFLLEGRLLKKHPKVRLHTAATVPTFPILDAVTHLFKHCHQRIALSQIHSLPLRKRCPIRRHRYPMNWHQLECR